MAAANFLMTNLWARGLVLIAAVIAVFAIAVLLRQPKADRDWDPALSRAPQFVFESADRWVIRDYRAFSFLPGGRAAPRWRDETINPQDLQEIWYFVEPFERWDAAAHSFLSFVFDGDDPKTISVSVEARREFGETYSGARGVFNAYELLYVWSSEKDVLTRIAVGLDHEVYAYRLTPTPEQARAILAHFAERTNALYERPRFYNTLTSNCTNELAKAVNGAFPGALPWHVSHVLTGRSAERLHHLGYIAPDDADFAAIRAGSTIRDHVKAAAEAPERRFPELWRAGFSADRALTRQ